MSHTCKRCGETKAAADMIQRRGKPSQTCSDCFRAACGHRKPKAPTALADVVERRTEVSPAEVPQPVEISAAIEVLPGFGFRATVENDRLVVEQDDAEGKTDNVVLSRTEAKVLFAQFAEWAA